MLNFKEFILFESMITPEAMKKTFDGYFKHTSGQVNFDKRNRNRLNFHTTKSVANEIIAIIDSTLGFGKNKYFTTSPVTKEEGSKLFKFSITFK